MQNLLQSMQQTALDPSRTHAAIVHLPIVAAMLGFILLLMLMFSGARSAGLRWAAVVVYLVGTMSGITAMRSGEQARDHVAAAVTLSPDAADLLHHHEELGEKVWIPLAVATVLIVLTAFRVVAVRVATLTLAILAALAALGLVIATAHWGGELVYVHGVGVPSTENNMPQATAPSSSSHASSTGAAKPPAKPATAPSEDDGESAE